MKIDGKEAAALLEQHDDILILTHAHPDGDTLGCGFGLCRALHKLGKRARVENSDVIADKYSYLYDTMETQDGFTPAYIVAVDVATKSLLGGKFEEYGRVDLCIDHHASNTFYAEKTFVDDHAGAACELIYQIIVDLGAAFDRDMANCIYTGLSTDTGCFKYANATARTYRIAARMIEEGANSAEINRVMFDTITRTYARLERMVYDSMRMYFDGRCAVVKVTQQMYRRSGSNENETDPIASIPRQIEGVLVGITIKEREDGTCKASVRTRDGFSASALCEAMGGGGHQQAAACSFSVGVNEAEQMLLSQVERMLAEGNTVS
ncbi:MAG: bifunctional oligoribonuclease/PAP phosphatase NrnA [Clostridiales bacterium]|nr:bifunctional oligoribonuclease/PAP phosphatase NrnA [Clostridiales bacterium]